MTRMTHTGIVAGLLAAPIMASTLVAASPAVAVAAPAMTASMQVQAPTADQDDKRTAAAARGSRSMTMRTYNTGNSPAVAAMKLKKWAQQGKGGYHNRCLKLADDAYQPKGNRTSTALSQWNRAKRAGVAKRKGNNPPVGAQMFWRTSHPAGHIATYMGDGKVATNVPGGRIKIVSKKKVDKWGPYLGWAEPYYGRG